jgi:hypothetical protein
MKRTAVSKLKKATSKDLEHLKKKIEKPKKVYLSK